MAELDIHKLHKDFIVWTNVTAHCIAFLDHPSPDKRVHLKVKETRSRVVIRIPSFADGLLEFCIMEHGYMPQYFTMHTEDVPDEMSVELKDTKQFLLINGVVKGSQIAVFGTKYGRAGRQIYNEKAEHTTITVDIGGETEIRVVARKFGYKPWEHDMKVHAGKNTTRVAMIKDSVL